MASRIKGITVEIGGDTTGLEKALKNVNSTIKSTQSELKDVERLLKLDPSNTELLTQKQKLLKDAISSTSEKLEALKEAQKQAKEQLENGELGQDKYDALQREIIETEQELKRLQEDAATTSKILSQIDVAGDKFIAAGEKITSAGQAVMPASVAVMGLGTAAVKTAADFDSAMSQVSAVSGATGDDFDALREKAREMGAKTKFSASEAAEAMNYMAMAGWKTGDMLDGIEGIMNLAAASGEDLATTSDIVTDALTAFGLSAADSGHFADILAATSSNANTNVAMMGETFKYCAPIAGAMGYTAEDVAEAIGLMANSGIKSTQAGTALRTMMTKLQGELELSGSAFGEVTVQTANADGSMRELGDILGDLRVYFSQMTESEAAAAAETLVGKNAMSGFLAVMQAAPGDIEKLNSAIANCDGTAEDMAATMQDNLTGQLTILKSQLEELAISFGDMLMPVIRKVVTAVQRFVDKLNNMDEGTRETILQIGLLVAALGPVLLIIGKLSTGIGKGLKAFVSLSNGLAKLKVGITSASGLLGKLGAAIGGISAPVVAVVAVIAVLAAAFANLWKNNEEFRNKMTEIWNGIKETISGFCQGIVERINSLGFEFSSITELLSTIWNGFCELLAPVFEGAFSVISNVLSTTLDVLLSTVDFFIAVFSGDWQGAWDAVKNIFTTLWDGLVSFFKTILETIKGILDTALGWIGTSWEQVWTGIKTFFTDIWNVIKNTVSTVINSISNTISTVINGIRNTVSNVFNSISSTVSSIWNGIKSTTTSVWNSIKSAITAPIDAAKEHIRNALDSIKNFFANCRLSLPSIKLPHFSISGSFSLNPPSVPHISISWYKNGGIMMNPTIFGLNGSSLMAGGEAGPEAILPLSDFYDKLENILTSRLNTSGMEKYLAVIAANSGKGIYLDDGTLVGHLLPAIDGGLADYSIRTRRGNR